MIVTDVDRKVTYTEGYDGICKREEMYGTITSFVNEHELLAEINSAEKVEIYRHNKTLFLFFGSREKTVEVMQRFKERMEGK